MSLKVGAAVALLMFAVAADPADANVLIAADLAADTAILSQFNVVTFGNYSAGNETEGRIVVGGNFSGGGFNAGFNNNFGNTTTNIGGQQYGEVTVFGNVTGGFNPGGNTFIAGTSSGTFNNLNGAGFNVVGSAVGSVISGAGSVNTTQPVFLGVAQNTQLGNIHTGVAATTVFPFGASVATNFQTPLTTLATALGLLPTTAGVTAQALPSGNNLSFTANNDYSGGGLHYGVVTTSYDNLASEQNFAGINNNGNAATVVVVTGNDPSVALPNLNGNNTESSVIWDFVDATTLRFNGAWYGTILAPNANITQQSGDLTGPVLANSLTQTNEVHANYLFAGNLSGLTGLSTGGGSTVPEPATIAVLGVGLLGMGFLRRRA